jgi:Glycosyltransferase family 87
MLDLYRWGALSCMLAAVALALSVGRLMFRAGQPVYACAFAAVLLVANPLVVKALRFGHPEEILAAALCTGALLAAFRRRPAAAAVMFALALATKQSALVLAGPMVLAIVAFGLPWRRFAAAAALTAIAVVVPFAAADPGGFARVQDRAGTIPVTNWQPASPYSVWYPFTPAKDVRIRPVDGKSFVRVRPVLPFAAAVAKKLIVILPLLLAIPLILRRRRLSATDPLLFAAFALLLRCVLDPFDNPYYHLPFLCAFLAWEGLTLRGVPVLALSASFAFVLATSLADLFSAVAPYTTHAAVYLASTVPLLAFMGIQLYAPSLGQRVRQRLTRALPNMAGRRRALAHAH